MLRSTDKDYQETKKVKQGKSEIDSRFNELISWINSKYKVQVLNIYHDILHENTTRVQIIFEGEKETNTFYLDEHSFNVSKRKQNAVAKKYIELVDPKVKFDEMFVLFCAFKPIAKEEVQKLISNKFIDRLHAKYSDLIWVIKRFGEHVIFFFYTKKQRAISKKNSFTDNVKMEYFLEMKKHDEFDYYTLENFTCHFDSKENFDTKYKGNWRYYFD